MFSSVYFGVSGLIPRPLIHFDLALVHGIKWWCNFIFLLVAVQISQYHLLKSAYCFIHYQVGTLSPCQACDEGGQKSITQVGERGSLAAWNPLSCLYWTLHPRLQTRCPGPHSSGLGRGAPRGPHPAVTLHTPAPARVTCTTGPSFLPAAHPPGIRPPARQPPVLTALRRRPRPAPGPRSHWSTSAPPPSVCPGFPASHWPTRVLPGSLKKKKFYGRMEGAGAAPEKGWAAAAAAAGGREGRRRESRAAEPGLRAACTFLPPAPAAPGRRHDGECPPEGWPSAPRPPFEGSRSLSGKPPPRFPGPAGVSAGRPGSPCGADTQPCRTFPSPLPASLGARSPGAPEVEGVLLALCGRTRRPFPSSPAA